MSAVAEPTGDRLLGADDVYKYFPIKKGVLLQREIARVHAVDGVSFDVRPARRWGWSASPAAASRRWAAA